MRRWMVALVILLSVSAVAFGTWTTYHSYRKIPDNCIITYDGEEICGLVRGSSLGL
jgi:hypothetical protein